jgi:GNAT superfamily N-acetyltransferase
LALLEIKEIAVRDAGTLDELVSRAFQYQAPHHFLEDFPIWGTDRALRLGIFEKNQLVSHVGIRFCEMQTSRGFERIALIGAVATHEEHRGKGLSTTLLRDAIQRVEARSCHWSVLWGSEHEFYGRLGFKLEGTQARALISDLAINTAGLQSSPVKAGLTESIFQDFLRRKTGIQFTEADRSWFFSHPTVEWHYLDEPFSYVAYQRGMDLKHMVHEMGGDLRGIQKILYHIYLQCPIAQVMGQTDDLIKLGFPMKAIFEENLCLARPTFAGEKWKPEYWISGLSAC